MGGKNFERMLQLVEEVFDMRNDPDQLDVNEEVMEKLRVLHPDTLLQQEDENGPYCWILLIPTSEKVMYDFLHHHINEKQILGDTRPDQPYEAVYLCSALVLPEYRKRGIAEKVTIRAIENIKRQHPIKALFVWPFTEEGNALAEKIAKKCNLPLLKRK